jgi:hypothetical protein
MDHSSSLKIQWQGCIKRNAHLDSPCFNLFPIVKIVKERPFRNICLFFFKNLKKNKDLIIDNIFFFFLFLKHFLNKNNLLKNEKFNFFSKLLKILCIEIYIMEEELKKNL